MRLGKRRAPVSLDDIGGCFQHEVPQQVGNDIELRAVAVQPFGISRGELRDFRFGATATGREISSVVGGQEVGQPALDDAQSMTSQLQVADHFGIEQRHGVRRHRVTKPG